MLFQAAQAGLGVALAPLPFISGELSSGAFVLLSNHTVRSSITGYLICAAAKSGYQPLEAFRDWLLEALRESEAGGI
jgi:LysR family glycine cleavage system transcriptional activator